MKTRISSRFSLITLPILLACLLPLQIQASPVVSEKIIFLNVDGKHYVKYDTRRTDHQTYDIWFKKRKTRNPESHLDNYLYLYPDEHRWDRNAQPNFDLMKIDSGSFASLVQDRLDFNSEISIGKDGVYTYTNWDGKTKTPDNHFGVWNKPEDFSQLVHAWVFPDNFNIISYKANRRGKWVKRNNTITYYGDNVNDVVFTIKYQPNTNPVYKELIRELAQQKGDKDHVQLEQSASGVKITLMATVLFSSGSTELSHQGKLTLRWLAGFLSRREELKYIIEGHTDSLAIKGDLAKRFKTNWELSSARALTVLHYLARHGVAESNLEARAHSSNIPISSNNTTRGRAKNRRIEILLAPLPKS
jgi:outer membrane protein OmpA-like peptidoglycan-associated protein